MSDMRKIEMYVDVTQAKFIDSMGGELPLVDKPHLYYGEKVIMCLRFVDNAVDLNPVPFDVTDAFQLAVDNNFIHTDPLMVYSDNTSVNIPGDWDQVDLTLGRISIRLNCHTDGYESKIGALISLTGYMEVKKITFGIESVMLQDNCTCHNVVDAGGSGPLPLHDYYDVDESDSRYQLKDVGAIEENIAVFDASGNTVDSGYKKNDVDYLGKAITEKTISYIVTTANCDGRVFSNYGATGDVTFILPVKADGLIVRFNVEAAFNLYVDPDGTDQIFGLTNAGGDRILASTIGYTVTLRCTSRGWYVISYYGTWTDAD